MKSLKWLLDTAVWFVLSWVIRLMFIVLTVSQVAYAQIPPTPPTISIWPRDVDLLNMMYHKAGNTEFAACMLGTVRGDTLDIDEIGIIDMLQQTDRTVMLKQPCANTYSNSLGTIHSHPSGLKCSHYLVIDRSMMGEKDKTPYKSAIPNSDWIKFMQSKDRVNFIYCGDRIVWMGRDGVEIQIHLKLPVQPGGSFESRE